MNQSEIDEAREHLRTTFETSAEWRRLQAVEHPYDARNLEAATTLDRLAGTVEAVSDPMMEAYEDLFKDIDESQRQAETLRLVGFSYEPSSAEEFVKDRIAKSTEVAPRPYSARSGRD